MAAPLFELHVNRVDADRPWAIRRKGWKDWQTAVDIMCFAPVWTRRRKTPKAGRPTMWLEGRGYFSWSNDRKFLSIHS